MSVTQRRILREQAYFANAASRAGWSVELFGWVNSAEGWPLWLDYLNACRAVRQARGIAPRSLGQGR